MDPQNVTDINALLVATYLGLVCGKIMNTDAPLFKAGWHGRGFLKGDENIMKTVPNFQCPKCGKMSVVFELVPNIFLNPIYSESGSHCYGTYRCLACGYVLGSGYGPCE